VVAKRENDRAGHDAEGRPFCALESCPTFDVKKYLHQLQQALPRVPPIPVRTLRSLHATRDYEGMVRLIKNTMNVEVRLVVGWVNSGGPNEMKDAPAWVKLPTEMPFYGTEAFRGLTITIFLRRSFLEQSAYDQVAIAVAHELSHVVLESTKHPLRRCEKAVDLTAMLLGFSRLYESAGHTEERFGNITTRRHLGYLSPHELQIANQILTPVHWRFRTKAARVLLATVGLFSGILLLVGGLFAWSSASVETQKQQPAEDLTQPGPDGGFMVQLFSGKSEAEARKQFRALQGKYPSALGGVRPAIRRADLGDHGVFYRAQVGPFSTADLANQFCYNLKSVGGKCIVQRN
jgi:hypothetical protein